MIDSLKLDFSDAVALFAKLERCYSKTSYFWMQRGLLKQLCKEYDEADTFLNQALAIRTNSYQIRHALAKNKLEKAVYICSNNYNEGDDLYVQGTEELRGLIESPRFSNNIGHSVHSYILMTLKYYKKRKKIIEKETLHPQSVDKHCCILRRRRNTCLCIWGCAVFRKRRSFEMVCLCGQSRCCSDMLLFLVL